MVNMQRDAALVAPSLICDGGVTQPTRTALISNFMQRKPDRR
jgi:hypothetical protein